MERYPEETIAISSKGKREVRVLMERGSYVKYTYYDEKTGKVVKEGKESILLKPLGSSAKELEQIFLIPISKGKSFAIREKKRPGKLWNPKTKKAEEAF